MNKVQLLLLNDKFHHFVYGVAIYSVMVPFGIPFAFAFLIAVATIKELYDKKGYGTFEIRDGLYTVSGGVYLQSWYYVFGYLSVLF